MKTTFYLQRKRYELDEKPLLSVESDGDVAQFHISKVERHHGGKYHCIYRPQTGFSVSENSDGVDLLVVGE